MITMDELNSLYIDKLERTRSHDQAIRKVWWDAYKKGASDKGKIMDTIEVKILDEKAIVPTRGHATDAGLDLYWTGEFEFMGVGRTHVVYKTGIAINIPEGFVGIIKPRSGVTIKSGYDVLAGVIDAGYTGEIKVVLDKYIDINAGDKFAQIVIMPIVTPKPMIVDEFNATDRGANGFGSTGV